jgi:DNA-binding Xre family transcriptional regulator
METTFDKFINNDPKQKALFDKEYNEFLLSEFILQKMEEENISIRVLAQKAGVSPTIIQKIRGQNAEKINFRTFTSVLNTLGYKINIEKIQV